MRRLLDAIRTIEVWIAGTFLVLMVALIFTGAIARTLGQPQNWTTSAATALFAWACFLSADIAWRRNSMMAIEVLTDRLPGRLQSLLRLVNYALIVIFLAYLIYMGVRLSWLSRIRSFQGIPWISFSWVTMSLPIGGALLLVTTVQKVRAELRGERAVNRALDVT